MDHLYYDIIHLLMIYSPHLCVGFLFLVLHPVRRLLLPLPSPPPVTHNLCQLVHTQLAHTQLAHTQLVHIQLAHTQLAHTQLVFTQIVHTQLVITQLVITPLVSTLLVHTQLVHLSSHHLSSHYLYTHNLLTRNLSSDNFSSHLWRGRHGTYGTGLALVARLVLGVAPGTPRLLAWQAWHFVTSIFTLCGRRGTWWHGSSLCVAGVALMSLGWLWWRACFPGGEELALSEATWCYWISVFSVVCLAGLLFGCKSFTWLHRPILHHLFSLSCFPHAIFTFLLLLVGRSWHVALSGPLIFKNSDFP